MAVYTIGVIISALLGFVYSRYRNFYKKSIIIKLINNKRHKISIDLAKFIPMLPLAIIASIRYGVGQDYFYTYVPVFNKVLAGQANEAWGDIGYTFLNVLVTYFTDDYAGIFILTSCMFIYFVFKAIYEDSDNIPLSIILLVFMGYYFCFMNGVRQMLATSILLFSIKYIKQRNAKKFFFYLLGASLIHLSAIIFIPVYFIYTMNWSNKKMMFFIIFSYALSDVISKIMMWIISFTKYNWYLDSTYKAERNGIILVLINLILFIFAILFNKNKKNDIYIKLQCLSVIVMSFIGKIPVANRIQWIFGLSSIILLPNVIKCQKDKETRVIVTLLVVILYALYFWYTIGVKNSNNVLPYRTIFSR